MIYELGQANRLGNRETNQDRFTAIETEEGVLLILADGMGGQAHGEVAAQLLIDTARHCYQSASRPIPQPDKFLDGLIAQTHQAIREFGLQQQPPATPGTTAVLCLVQEGQARWAHVGDSRLYLFQNGLPIYRTTDHSLVEKLFQEGVISRREQETHPKRNQITKCLGCQPKVPEPTLSHAVNLSEEDVLLLCTDGLWGAMDDATIGTFLGHSGNLDDIINAMAEKAERLSYPQSDNVSVLALRVLSLSPTDHRHSSQQGKSGSLDSDPLLSAIANIEAALEEYKKEINK